MIRFWVDEQDAGLRVDHWLVTRFPERSRSELQRWIRDEGVLVDGRSVKTSHRLDAGEEVSIAIPPPETTEKIEARPIPLEFVYEDADLVVVNKAAGMVVHPAPGHQQDTLVNAILHHCPDLQGIGGEVRPGIVHRLDKETSGLIIVAKNDAALRNLQSQFKARSVDKRYTALLEGRLSPPRARVSVPIGRHPVHRMRQAAYTTADANATARIREAVTEYETIGQFTTSHNSPGGPAAYTLVDAKLLTGRTHQLRVHFAWMKHPIVGDTLYGYRKQRLPVGRLFLHARQISFTHPSTGERITLEAELPTELSDALIGLIPS